MSSADLIDDEAELLAVFANRDASRRDNRKRLEKRTQLTDRQRSRGGRARNVQVIWRTTEEYRDLAEQLSEKLGLSRVDLFEQMVAEMAKKHGLGG